jgi:hypothetical protein
MQWITLTYKIFAMKLLEVLGARKENKSTKFRYVAAHA